MFVVLQVPLVVQQCVSFLENEAIGKGALLFGENKDDEEKKQQFDQVAALRMKYDDNQVVDLELYHVNVVSQLLLVRLFPVCFLHKRRSFFFLFWLCVASFSLFVSDFSSRIFFFFVLFCFTRVLPLSIINNKMYFRALPEQPVVISFQTVAAAEDDKSRLNLLKQIFYESSISDETRLTIKTLSALLQ